MEVYWGNSTTDKAALEVTLVYYDPNPAVGYTSHKLYLDHTTVRTPDNGFEQIACTGYTVGSNSYQCKKILNFTPTEVAGLMLIRVRLLYNATPQPIAFWAVTCLSAPCTPYSLPPQARTIVSTGVSVDTQRQVKVFQLYKVVPTYFNYAIFSAGDISK